MPPVAVVGAGNSGFAMAAHLKSAGHQVRLWNRPGSHHFSRIKEAGGIQLSGKITGCFMPDLLTDEIQKALIGVRLILVTVPAHAHRIVIEQMASHLTSGQTIVLNPGRTGGALEADYVLRRRAPNVDVTLAETQTILYTCRKKGSAGCEILEFKRNVEVAALEPCRTESVIAALPPCLQPHFVPAKNVLSTSLGNVGMILHCAPVLMNSGWIETAKTPFKYYYDAITPTVANFLERLDQERVGVARACGCAIPTVSQWLRLTYGVSGDGLYECIRANANYATIDAPKTLHHRYLTEDVPTGLVPLEALGRALGVPVPLTTIVIDLANALLAMDFRQIGRGRQALGLLGLSRAEVMARVAA